MLFARDLSLRHRLTLLVTLTSGLVLTLAAFALLTYDLRSLRQETEDDLRSLARVIASNSTAALTFNDPRTAGEILSGLEARQPVVSACLYDSKGRSFAVYHRRGAEADPLPARALAESYATESAHVVLFQDVRLGDEVIGALYLKSDLGHMRSRFQAYLVVLVLVMLGSLALAGLLSSRWQRQISEPILRLAAAAGSVAQSKDYSVRVPSPAGGELGVLTDAFNEMLAEIQKRDHDLKSEMGERQNVESALRASESKFRSIVETTNEWVWSSDVLGRSTYDNPAVERILGYTPKELLGKPFADVLHPEEWGGDEERRRDLLLKKGFTNVVHRIRHKDGSYRTLESSGTPIFDGDGNMIGFQGTARDITESRGLEEQLRQAQKMEAVGRLAGGVAHDFNNLLSVIVGYADLVTRSGLPPAAQRKIDEIKKAGDRATALVRQLLAFSRKQVLAPKVLDLGALVMDFAKMLPRVLREDVSLVIEAAPELGQVRADPGQIEQILMNLAVNGRDAMPEGGTLRITTKNVTLDEGYARAHVGTAPGRFVVLAVSDTGCGMDEKTLARAFEPFFTTKEQGKGTGLGLATVYGIVKQSEGHLAVESAPGKGTTFQIYLPRVDSPVSSDERGLPPEEPARRGTETILLVEDEAAVRSLLAEVLRGLGHTVLTAESGLAALEASDRHEGPIHLLLSDVVMPGISGRQVAEELLQRRPATKVVYMSGHADDTLEPRGVLHPELVLLTKPFSTRALNDCLREVLG